MGNYFSYEKTKQDFSREKQQLMTENVLPNCNSINSQQHDIEGNLKVGENLTVGGILFFDTNSQVIGPRIYTDKNGDLIFATSCGNELRINNNKPKPPTNTDNYKDGYILCNSTESNNENLIVNGSTNITEKTILDVSSTNNVIGKLSINGIVDGSCYKF